MLHTKFRENRPAGSGEEDFLKGFTIYGVGSGTSRPINISARDSSARTFRPIFQSGTAQPTLVGPLGPFFYFYFIFFFFLGGGGFIVLFCLCASKQGSRTISPPVIHY